MAHVETSAPRSMRYPKGLFKVFYKNIIFNFYSTSAERFCVKESFHRTFLGQLIYSLVVINTFVLWNPCEDYSALAEGFLTAQINF